MQEPPIMCDDLHQGRNEMPHKNLTRCVMFFVLDEKMVVMVLILWSLAWYQKINLILILSYIACYPLAPPIFLGYLTICHPYGWHSFNCYSYECTYISTIPEQTKQQNCHFCWRDSPRPHASVERSWKMTTLPLPSYHVSSYHWHVGPTCKYHLQPLDILLFLTATPPLRAPSNSTPDRWSPVPAWQRRRRSLTKPAARTHLTPLPL